ncbi:glycoside hydrolase family 16 protein [Aureibaculum marinum]|uniref:Glycoside hydrolase family 16 protein n=1 Tax=Aureibaculum marinum TaxID=2487930 RepID=A0A3N4NIC4_9FLAO|nr:glycoside hydrolase family 16 protein [Aureibaculum marinum]RPD93046.1 glycoside hydrolase family 16 protein [Aureibaculum marinum]
MKKHPLVVSIFMLSILLVFTSCSNDKFNTDQHIGDIEENEGNNPDTPDEEPVTLDPRLPADIDSTYTITFEDNFNQAAGTLPDANKWKSRLPWGPDVIINKERQYYTDVLNGDNKAPNPFNFDGEHLIITAGLNTPEQAEATGQDYYSGVLSGAESTPYRDGYIEAKIWYEPDVDGFWGAFWLLHKYYSSPEDTGANGISRTEIDWEFVRGPGGEFLGGPYDTDQATIAYHYNDGEWSISRSGYRGPNNTSGTSVQCDGTPLNQSSGIGPVTLPEGGDIAGEWHRYGVWKTDEFIKWYFDGVMVASICDPEIVSQIEMYPIINIAVGGNYPGPPNPEHFPTSMLVDYICLWEPK